MPKREIGLMGYVGEAIVYQWLKYRFPQPEYEIVGQVMPSGISRVGGPYLDFAVVRNRVVESLYEVKSQDFIWESRVNKGLEHVWKNRGVPLVFHGQGGSVWNGHATTEAFLVLLVGPNTNGIRQIGESNLKNVILFGEILLELGDRLDRNAIFEAIQVDLPKVIDVLHSPRNGSRVTPTFLETRKRYANPPVQKPVCSPLNASEGISDATLLGTS